MDDEVHRTPGGRSEDTSPDPEMAEGGSIGRWPVVRDETGYAAGGSGITADRQRVRKVVLGYYQYHAVPGNTTQLRIFKLRVCRLWQSVLVRRSQRAQMRWERFTPVLNRWIPPPRVLHPYPDARFYATHPL